MGSKCSCLRDSNTRRENEEEITVTPRPITEYEPSERFLATKAERKRVVAVFSGYQHRKRAAKLKESLSSPEA
jgi:hypothetical protein